jgi:hypothetical protein
MHHGIPVTTRLFAVYDKPTRGAKDNSEIFIQENQRCIRLMTGISVIMNVGEIGEGSHKSVRGFFWKIGGMSN